MRRWMELVSVSGVHDHNFKFTFVLEVVIVSRFATAIGFGSESACQPNGLHQSEDNPTSPRNQVVREHARGG